MLVLSVVFLSFLFSLNRLVDDLEDAFIQNFDSEEKVKAFTRVVQDFDVLRKLSVKIREGTLKPPKDGKQ